MNYKNYNIKKIQYNSKNIAILKRIFKKMVYIRYNNNLDCYIDYNDTDIYNQLTMNYQDRLNFYMDNFIDEGFPYQEINQ